MTHSSPEFRRGQRGCVTGKEFCHAMELLGFVRIEPPMWCHEAFTHPEVPGVRFYMPIVGSSFSAMLEDFTVQIETYRHAKGNAP